MSRKSSTFRLPTSTRSQLVALAEEWGVSQAEVIVILCTAEMARKERQA